MHGNTCFFCRTGSLGSAWVYARRVDSCEGPCEAQECAFCTLPSKATRQRAFQVFSCPTAASQTLGVRVRKASTQRKKSSQPHTHTQKDMRVRHHTHHAAHEGKKHRVKNGFGCKQAIRRNGADTKELCQTTQRQRGARERGEGQRGGTHQKETKRARNAGVSTMRAREESGRGKAALQKAATTVEPEPACSRQTKAPHRSSLERRERVKRGT